MESLTLASRLLESLVASGPVAVVLGYMLLTVWKELKAERAKQDARSEKMFSIYQRLAEQEASDIHSHKPKE